MLQNPFCFCLKLFHAHKCHPGLSTACIPTTILATVFVCVLGTVMLWYTVIYCSMGRACFEQQRLNGKPEIGLE